MFFDVEKANQLIPRVDNFFSFWEISYSLLILSLIQLFTQRRIAEGRTSQERKEENLQIFLARPKETGTCPGCPAPCGAGTGIRLLLDHSVDSSFLCLEPYCLVSYPYVGSMRRCLPHNYHMNVPLPTEARWDQNKLVVHPHPMDAALSNENADFWFRSSFSSCLGWLPVLHPWPDLLNLVLVCTCIPNCSA